MRANASHRPTSAKHPLRNAFGQPPASTRPPALQSRGVTDLLGVIVGGVGSLAALIYAHIAYRNAKASTKIAEDSRTLARESNEIAADARGLAEEANEFSRRSEQREIETHDVHWDGDWEYPGRYVLTKLGDDEAHNVKATVSYDGERVTQEAEVIRDSGHQLVFEFPSAVADFQREARQHVEDLRAARNVPYGLGVPSWGTHPHTVEERVHWTTPRGTPQHHEEEFRLSTFDHWYPDA